MTDCDSSRQSDEIEALSAIYGDDFLMVNETEKLFDVRVRHEENSWWSLTLQVLLPKNYPSSVPPVFEVHGTWLGDCDEFELRDKLYEIYRDNKDECVVFQWVEAARDFMNEKSVLYGDEYGEDANEVADDHGSPPMFDQTSSHDTSSVPPSITWQTDKDQPEILHGEPITDRKSTFQAHLAKVNSEQDVKDVLNELKKTRKIANASHNISAYRIAKENSQVIIQDCDDDGENNGGSRLLHLLQILNVQNYLIVVSRWYGGILLGPDRFKHINNCARNLLKDAKVIQDSARKQPHNHKESKIKTRKIKNKH
ncbi:protein IMPACT-like [Dendronephthya gigantea]|uniref:protein IMPACT-like n=1 Tax=Dendronephthya gigantea TaxID=151771 RepID=UPI00106A4678|nr:protein IMPACT-like [Dendronephthya gigantea]